MTFPTTHPALARALAARDYAVPTTVQLAVLEPHAVGQDLVVSAQTGSGKTVAFGLALAPTLLGEAERFENAAAPLALIVAPTRELALQVQRELVWLYGETNAKIVTCVGGMDVRTEARALNFGAHIVVGTPGRLRDHLERKRLDLSKLKAVVLDEADEMLDLGFREDLEFILDATPAERQTLLFSATMPREIEALAQRYQRNAVRIATARRDEQHADIDYRAMRVAQSDVENAVVNVLRFHESRATLVFCATRDAVKKMHARLLERGFGAVALSGELTQAERTQALQALRDGRARVLVATDVAARGLDLPDLALVIHADLPNNGETLLHRSGRTGRAGKKGLCVLIVPFNRRRKAEALLGTARLRVTWEQPPAAEAIRQRDQERFLADPMFGETPTDAERSWATALMAARTPDEIAMALVRIARTRLPEPEELSEDMGPPRRERTTRSDGERAAPRFERSGDRDSVAPHTARPPRDRREMVWFRLNIGRERNADPRWILPLICRNGGVSKTEIGAIRIYDKDTRFQIVAEFADQFAEVVRTNKSKEGQISRIGARNDADDATVLNAIEALPTTTGAEWIRPAAEPVKVFEAKLEAPAETLAAHPVEAATPPPILPVPEMTTAPAAAAEVPTAAKPDTAPALETKPTWERKPRNDAPPREPQHGAKSESARPFAGKPKWQPSERSAKPDGDRPFAAKPKWERKDRVETSGDKAEARPARHFDKPKPEGDRPFAAKPKWERKDRVEASGDKAEARQARHFDKPKPEGDRPFAAKPKWERKDRVETAGDKAEARPARHFDKPKPHGERPFNGKPKWERRDRSTSTDGATAGTSPRTRFAPKPDGDRPFHGKPKWQAGERSNGADAADAGPRPQRDAQAVKPEGARPFAAKPRWDRKDRVARSDSQAAATREARELRKASQDKPRAFAGDKPKWDRKPGKERTGGPGAAKPFHKRKLPQSTPSAS